MERIVPLARLIAVIQPLYPQRVRLASWMAAVGRPIVDRIEKEPSQVRDGPILSLCKKSSRPPAFCWYS